MRLRLRLDAHAAVPLSYEQREELGGGVRIPVAGTLNGTAFRTTSFRMGDFTGIAFRKEVLRAAGVAPGDDVDIELRRDTDERTVEPPPALAESLAGDPIAKSAYEAMSYTHRREYAEWIGQAKQEETRRRRLTKAIELLREGRPLR
ncbi:MAG: YdeI/OmpD-associated family protein [Actinomycetota bacterium]|nr:YdeI/OmpD-associated family protein [Actinomycetota bacterium]